MDNEKVQPTKLDIILKKKQYLDESIKACEIRIDEKLASLVEEGIISREMNPDLFNPDVHDLNQPEDHFLSGIDISDDDALDQAVRNSRPFDNKGNQLAFAGDDLLIDKTSKSMPGFDTETITPEEDDDEELPTLSKILGRPTSPGDDFQNDAAFIQTESPESETASDFPAAAEEFILVSDQPDVSDMTQPSTDAFTLVPDVTGPSETAPPSAAEFILAADQTKTAEQTAAPTEPILIGKDSIAPEAEQPSRFEATMLPEKRKSAAAKKKKAVPDKKIKAAVPKPNLTAMILPAIFFISGLALFGVFLTLAAQTFNFVDYSVLFILFTCLIFTIALPFSASIFFMILLLCSYIALSFISVFYLEVPFELYQIGWIVIIPLLLSSSTLMIKKVRELFEFKKALERQIAAYDNLEESPGLTIEKAHYKDLKYAMERAARGETILTLEMISISHLETLKSINGSRLWDEILYKTMKIIKQHCYNTHLIYILDGHIFSIIMENTSVKNQLLINQGITEAFHALIAEYDAIDAEVKLNIAPVPYSRDITNPFDYRTLGLRHLNSSDS